MDNEYSPVLYILSFAHKYACNFITCKWQEVMSCADDNEERAQDNKLCIQDTMLCKVEFAHILCKKIFNGT